MRPQQDLDKFLANGYAQIFCEKCAMTFLTNVYEYNDTNVLLEKRSLGLEYYCGAIHNKGLTKVPEIVRIGILDEEGNKVKAPSVEEVYSGEETDLRFIYKMEKLRHLDEEDSVYFDQSVKDLEWQSEGDRNKILIGVSKRYNTELGQDILKLYEYYKEHEGILAWDLHGDNLMQRLNTGEIVILDPYTRRC